VSREAFTPEACITARRRLAWTVDELADKAGIAMLTVEGFESGRRQSRYKTITALIRAFTRAGVTFGPAPGCDEPGPGSPPNG
jgi:transcriptional regulator with XRE-family HTH domain